MYEHRLVKGKTKPPGTPVTALAEGMDLYNLDSLVASMDEFSRRPKNANVPMAEARLAVAFDTVGTTKPTAKK